VSVPTPTLTGMATVVLFHSALGLRPAVHDFADALRAAGHEVHTPDYYDGETFDTVEDGVVKRDALGMAIVQCVVIAVICLGLISRLIYFTPAPCGPLYTLLTPFACKKACSAIG